GNADVADITRQEFRLLQAELREYGFRTEIAGYDALRLHTESRMLFADADSLRISPREARSLIEQAEKRQKDAQNADKKAADMLAEYERRKGILDTRLSELEKNGGAALAVLDAQQARLLGQQTLNDRNPVVTEDVEGDKKIYNAEVAEWDKLRQRLLDARNKITSAESAVNSARNNVSARTNEQKHANDALNALLKEKENIRSQLADINQKIAEEKRKRDEINMIKDAIKLTSDFYRTIYDEFGKQASELAKELASV
ncbi:colicin-like pore-forming protein, partial [Klebsiella pneumoniae]|uniref:colicin-like pore-forming protein n=1 Tax=Klebsiella pneumoniae TaxID=573 RepID=UPI002165CF8C